MRKPRLGTGLALVVVGLLALDVALVSPIVGLTEAALAAPGLFGGLACLVGGGVLLASVPTLRAKVVQGCLLALSLVLFVLGLVTHGQVGEFSDLGAIIAFMLALAAFVLFLAIALWRIDEPESSAWLKPLLSLAGISVALGLVSIRWPGSGGELAPTLLVAIPLVLMTLAAGGLLLRWLQASRTPAGR